MKKIYLLLCVLGVALPYYQLFYFLKENEWSMTGFWDLLYANHAVGMISMDLTVSAVSFLVFLIYQNRQNKIPIIKYIISLFLVGFSLALPLYLYNMHDKKKGNN